MSTINAFSGKKEIRLIRSTNAFRYKKEDDETVSVDCHHLIIGIIFTHYNECVVSDDYIYVAMHDSLGNRVWAIPLCDVEWTEL